MISYEFSKREKVLLVVLAVILLGIAWFMLVYQNTSNEVVRIDSEMSEVESAITLDSARVGQMSQMQAEIEQFKAEGAVPVEMPAYDNLRPLMMELNGVMAMASTYSISFDDVDTSSGDFAHRGVSINYQCGSYDAAVSIVRALANGRFPCTVDSITIVDGGQRSGSSAANAAVHVTFFEKLS